MRTSLLGIAVSVLLSCSAVGAGDLHEAAYAGKLEEVKKLLNKTPESVNARDRDGCTPLHLAARLGHLDVAKMLITKGADVGATIPDNVEYGKKSEKKVLYEFRSALQLMGFASIDSKSKIVYGFDGVKITYIVGDTPLHWCAEGGRTQLADLLLSKGAKANAKNLYGYTPLHIASGYGHKDLVLLLLKNKADTTAKTEDGKTALDIAVSNDRKEIVDVLKQQSNEKVKEAEQRNQPDRQ